MDTHPHTMVTSNSDGAGDSSGHRTNRPTLSRRGGLRPNMFPSHCTYPNTQPTTRPHRYMEHITNHSLGGPASRVLHQQRNMDAIRNARPKRLGSTAMGTHPQPRYLQMEAQNKESLHNRPLHGKLQQEPFRRRTHPDTGSHWGYASYSHTTVTSHIPTK